MGTHASHVCDDISVLLYSDIYIYIYIYIIIYIYIYSISTAPSPYA